MNTIEVKTSELEGAALDWAVAQAIGMELLLCGDHPHAVIDGQIAGRYQPSTDWSQGGPLIEKYRVSVIYSDEECDPCAWTDDTAVWPGPTPLIAACRAIVAAKLGAVVQVPADLIGGAA